MTDASSASMSALVRLLGEEPVGAVDLGGSDRSQVLRLTLADGSTVIAKHFTSDDADVCFARERTGLRHLARTPTLLASDEAARVLVMSDVGTAATLADDLLGADPDAAWSAAISWAGSLGDLVGSSIVDLPAIRAELSGVQVYDPRTALRTGAEALAGLTGGDVAALEHELATIEALLDSTDADVAWPTDTCPDNAVATEAGWAFLDLEGTDVHHAALVAAYPALPFATCWCVFDPPANLTDQMVAAFTLALSGHAPHITGRPEWRTEIDVASAAWVLAATAWLLPRALAGDAPIGPSNRLSPTRRRLLRSRWSWLAAHLGATLPALTAAGAAAAAWAEREWGDDAAPLDPYPAFAPPERPVDPESDAALTGDHPR